MTNDGSESIGIPPKAKRWLLVGLVTLVAVNLIAFVIGQRTVEQSGDPTPTENVEATGLFAYRELLQRNGLAVSDLGSPNLLDGQSTLILAGTDHRTSAPDAIRFASEGGRVIVFGDSPIFAGLMGQQRTVDPNSTGRSTAVPGVSAAELRGVSEVVASPGWQLDAIADTERLLIDGGGATTAARVAFGDGIIVGIADVTPLTNQLIATADNAAFGLAIVGSGPVTFDELNDPIATPAPDGIEPLPASWMWTLGLVTVAGAVWMAGASRRLGPPEAVNRPLSPSRKDFVESVAGTLNRTEQSGHAAVSLRAWARSEVVRRARLDHWSTTEDLKLAAASIGLSEGHIAVLLSDGTSPESTVAAGRLVATLSNGRVSAIKENE